MPRDPMAISDREIDAAVRTVLGEILGMPPDRIAPRDRIIGDLGLDRDLEFNDLFLPGLERLLGIAVDKSGWENVVTVGDAVSLLRHQRDQGRWPDR